jgi:hypothetical protein
MIVAFTYQATMITPDMSGMSHRLLSEGVWRLSEGVRRDVAATDGVTGRGQVAPHSF